MEMDYVSDFLHSSMDSRPRKRPRFAWDFPQSRPKTRFREKLVKVCFFSFFFILKKVLVLSL
uniref:Uncharacterized protein n=1 Tax=Rhizophora mucronata TaxID=61149 RepID=A0A2P2LIX8_RHIMU